MRKLKLLRPLCCSAALFACAFENVQAQKTSAVYEENRVQNHAPANDKNAYENNQQTTILDALKQLNKDKGIFFLIADKSLENTKVPVLKNTNGSIDSLLKALLKESNLTYKKVDENTYVIIPAKSLASNVSGLTEVMMNDNYNAAEGSEAAAATAITGRVKAANGTDLPGVSVTVKGTTRGVVTNNDGTYSINAEKGETLVFSLIGYANIESVIADNSVVDITLTENQSVLNEVVVTALGIKKQAKTVGYSTTEVDGSKLTDSREVNLGSALTGRVAGVSVAGTATGPYGSTRVTIRGNSSLQGNNQPLYVIDGIPLSSGNEGSSGQWGGADYGDPLSTINPDDIDNIQVLKGVAASALYGYRGGNGAVLITTKSGSRSKGIGLEVNNNATFTNVVDERDFQYEYGQGAASNVNGVLMGVKPTTAQFAQATAQSSWGGKLDGSDAVNFLGETVPYVAAKDNYKNFFQTGITNQTSVAVSGNSDKVTYRLGISNLYLNTNVPNSNMKNQGFNLNTTYNVTKKLQAILTANYTFETVKNRASFSDAPGNVLAAPMYLANSFDIRWLENRKLPNGDEILPGGQTDIYFENPYFIAYEMQNRTKRERLTGSLTLKYNIADYLSIQGQVTRDGNNFSILQITPNGVKYTNDGGGSITQTTSPSHELNANFLVDFNKTFGDFSVHANAGGNYQDNEGENYGIYGAGPFVVPFFYSSGNVTNKPFSYGYSHSRVNSLYASVDIGYKNYLYITGTARNDWFSTLNPNTNNYLYPSVSGSFVFSEAWHMPSWISFGKLRASYAYSSNGADPYQNLLTYGLNGYTMFGQPVAYVNQTNIPNNFLKPVRIAEQELGLNVQFLKGRAGVDVAVYNKKTTDDILNVTISGTSGYSGNIVNIGQLRNRGVELLLTGTPIKTRDFSWDASFNIATNANKVLKLTDELNDIVVDGGSPRFGDGVSIKHIVGSSYAQIVGYGYLRDDKGNKIFDTSSGLPMRTENPIAFGSGIYKTTGGFSNDFHYKNFTLSVLFDFKFGAKLYSQTNILLYYNGLSKETLVGREGGVIGEGVTPEGKPNTRAVYASDYYGQISMLDNQIAEEFVYDASFIKFRSLSIGYSLPAKMLKNSFVKGVSLSLVGRNIATLLKHTPNIDPESNLTGGNSQGLELSGYPAVRSLGVNLNVKF